MEKFADHVKRSNNSDFAPTPTWNQAVQIVEDAPAADVVKVVWCKDCKWKPRNMGYGMNVENLDFPLDSDSLVICPYGSDDPWYNREPDPNGFCSRGVRKDGADDAND